MIDATALAARRHSELHPGYQLVAAVDAAIPFSWLTLDVLAQERKPLPVVDEFVLRLCGQGVDTISDIAAVLGMNDDIVRDSVAQHLSAENLDYLPDPRPDHRNSRIISLTAAGNRAVDELEITAPHRIDLPYAFDRLLWAPSAHRRNDLVTRGDATSGGMVLLPSARTHEVTTQEITPRTLNRMLAEPHRPGGAVPVPSRRRTNSGTAEVLAVEAVTRQHRRYLPAVLLVYSAVGFDDVRLTVIVDDLSSQEHDRALVDIGGAAKLGISVAPPTGEPELPQHLLDQRVPYDTVRGLQRRAGATPADTSSPATRTASPEDDDSATARAELDALTVRSVPAFEHRELLTYALEHARHRFLLITSAIRNAVVTDDLVAQFEAMLRRTGITTRIAYGLGTPDREHDSGAVKRLHRLADRYDNLTIARLDGPHPHCLIFDDTWINSSFDWLSYRGGPSRVYRREEGTLIRASDIVDDRHTQYATSIASAHHTATDHET